jgi:RNA polymerase sigma-70 factor (ECF subfamily)
VERRPRFQTSQEQREELTQTFLAAAQRGDLTGLTTLLAHDVVLTGDGGGKVPALARSLRGRDRVARMLLTWMRVASRMPDFTLRPTELNGGSGVMILDDQQRLIGVWSLEIAGGEIRAINSVVNPDKLAHLGPLGDFAALVRGYLQRPDRSVDPQPDTNNPGETP